MRNGIQNMEGNNLYKFKRSAYRRIEKNGESFVIK
jgi:hypothetical protein